MHIPSLESVKQIKDLHCNYLFSLRKPDSIKLSWEEAKKNFIIFIGAVATISVYLYKVNPNTLMSVLVFDILVLHPYHLLFKKEI